MVSSYGQNRALLASYSQDQTFIEPIRLSSTFGMTFKTHLQPFWITSKAYLQPNESHSKGPNEASHSKESTRIQLFWIQLAFLLPQE